MFQCTFNQGTVFQKFIETIFDALYVSKHTDITVDLLVDEQGINIQGMDGFRISLINLTLKKSIFDEYKLDVGPLALRMEIFPLNALLKGMESTSSLKISYNKNTSNPLNFTFMHKTHNNVTSFPLDAYDEDNIVDDHLTAPQTQYTASISLPSTEFQSICYDLSNIGDRVQISMTPDQVKFTATNKGEKEKLDEASSSRNIPSIDSKSRWKMLVNGYVRKHGLKFEIWQQIPLELISVLISFSWKYKIKVVKQQDQEQTFSIKFFKNLIKATSNNEYLSKYINIEISTARDIPLQISYQITKDDHLRYYLAPLMT